MTLQLTIQRERPIVETSAKVQSRCSSLYMVKDELSVQPTSQAYNRGCNFTLTKAELTATPAEIVAQEVVDIYFGKIFKGPRGKSAYETAVEGGYNKSETEFNRALANIGGKSEGIADGAITTEKIYSRAVTSEKIAKEAIKAEHIVPNTITEQHLSQELRDKINDDAGYVWEFTDE